MEDAIAIVCAIISVVAAIVSVAMYLDARSR
jgi:hypothetical protein